MVSVGIVLSVHGVPGMIDCVPALIWSATSDGSIAFANHIFREYAGLFAPTVHAAPWTDLVHPDDRAAVAAALGSPAAAGAREVEVRLRRFDAEYRCHLLRWHPGGEPEQAGHSLFCAVDIDRSKRSESALRAELERRRRIEDATRNTATDFRLTVDSMPGMVCLHSKEGAIEHVNESLLSYTGRTLEELQDWPAVVHPDDRGTIMSLWEKSFTSGDPFDADLRVRDAHGRYQWFHCRGRALRDEQHHIVRWYNLLTDIEDRKRAEDALRASEESSRLILDNIAGLVTTHDANGKVEQVNGSFLSYTGGSFETLRSDTTILHADDRDQVLLEWKRCLTDGETLRTEARLRRADGVFRWFNITAVPFRNAQGRIVRWYSLLTDIDDRKSAEEALSKVQARLTRATQIATVSEMAAAIAHEVKQPLAAVVANGHACVRWLANESPRLDRAAESAEQVVRDGLRAGEVVERLRALFKRGNVQKAVLDVNQVVLEVVRLARAEAGRRGATVTTDLDATLPPVLGDRLQLQQVILNLLHNGLDAMETVTDRPRVLRIRSRFDGQREIVVQVEDEGLGVQHPDKAFDAFFTTKEHGMGMGLAICRSIVDSHDGRLWIAKSDELGTTLCVGLPALHAPCELDLGCGFGATQKASQARGEQGEPSEDERGLDALE